MNSKDIEAIIDEHKKRMQIDSWAVDLNYTVVKLSQNFINHLNSQCEELDLRHPSLPILYHLLHNSGKMTQKQLAQRLPASKQSIAITLKILRKKGLVTRKTLQRDQRANQIKLTDNGISTLLLNIPKRDKFYDRLMKYVGEEEGRKLTLSLRKINAFYERELKREKLWNRRLKNKNKLGVNI